MKSLATTIPLILLTTTLASALPKFPPLRYGSEDYYNQDVLNNIDTRYPPSAPTPTPMHTTALMAGEAMRTAYSHQHHTILRLTAPPGPASTLQTSVVPAVPSKVDL
jgi:hypothetical protein